VAEARLQTKPTPSQGWKRKAPRGTGHLTAKKRSYRNLQIQWQCFTDFTCGFLSLMFSFAKPDFSLVHPLPSTWERNQKLASLAHKYPPKQAQVHFSKVTAFKSLSVDMNTTSRLMPSPGSQTDGWGINTKTKLPIPHMVSPHLWQMPSSRPWLRMEQAHRAIWKSKSLGLLLEGRRKAVLVSIFPVFSFPGFLPASSLLCLEAAFFPFCISYKSMQSDLVCKNANTVNFLKYKQLQKSVESQL